MIIIPVKSVYKNFEFFSGTFYTKSHDCIMGMQFLKRPPVSLFLYYNYLNEILNKWRSGEGWNASEEEESCSDQGGKPSRRAGKKRKKHQTQQHRGEDGGLIEPTEAIQIKKSAAVKKGGQQDDNALFPGKFLGRLFMLCSYLALRFKDNSSHIFACHSLHWYDMLDLWGCSSCFVSHRPLLG